MVHRNYCVCLPPVIFDELLSYFDLSGMPGLTELSRTEESHSGPILIPESILYGDKSFTEVFVSIFGVLIIWGYYCLNGYLKKSQWVFRFMGCLYSMGTYTPENTISWLDHKGQSSTV